MWEFQSERCLHYPPPLHRRSTFLPGCPPPPTGCPLYIHPRVQCSPRPLVVGTFKDQLVKEGRLKEAVQDISKRLRELKGKLYYRCIQKDTAGQPCCLINNMALEAPHQYSSGSRTSRMEGGYYCTYLFTWRAVEESVAFTRNKSTEHGGEDLCVVVCDRLRLLTGAVLMDEQQGGYRVHRPILGTEAGFRFRRKTVFHLCYCNRRHAVDVWCVKDSVVCFTGLHDVVWHITLTAADLVN